MTRSLALVAVLGCAGLQSQGAAQRDAIHARHSACLARVRALEVRDFDAMRVFWCDEDETRACLASGLEGSCGEWEWGGT